MAPRAVAARKSFRIRAAECTDPPTRFPCRIIDGLFEDQADYDQFKQPTRLDYESFLSRHLKKLFS
jgi:hypothetical protein